MTVQGSQVVFDRDDFDNNDTFDEFLAGLGYDSIGEALKQDVERVELWIDKHAAYYGDGEEVETSW